jgi:hypothetical protein
MAKLKTKSAKKSTKILRQSNLNQKKSISEEQILLKFLDALVEDSTNDPSSLIIYTEDMAKEMDARLAIVKIEFDK